MATPGRATCVPELHAEVEAAWDCAVFDHWGMTETGYGGGVECSAHSGYHLREADLLVEVADPANGRACAPGVHIEQPPKGRGGT